MFFHSSEICNSQIFADFKSTASLSLDYKSSRRASDQKNITKISRLFANAKNYINSWSFSRLIVLYFVYFFGSIIYFLFPAYLLVGFWQCACKCVELS
jgi:hypothetical protein